jgi:hypothetical protein
VYAWGGGFAQEPQGGKKESQRGIKEPRAHMGLMGYIREPKGAHKTHGAHTGTQGSIHKSRGAYKRPNALSHLEFYIIWLEIYILKVQIIFKVRI